MTKILSVKDLVVDFHTEEGKLRAVDHVSFDLNTNQCLGIVGESGCGKSVTSLAIMQLIAKPPGEISGGGIFYQGENLLELDESKMRELRGNEISMIFQEPMTSLNPVFTIGNQISEVLELHEKLKPKEARDRSIELLKLVGIPAPDKRVDDYPHQLSGGMRQRAMIAIALACNPKILIADEPTTALDVTIQAQILDLLKELQEKLNMAIIMITHDLGVIAEFCDEVLVMYTGQVVEKANVEDLFKNPRHPYTKALLKSLPSISGHSERLYAIPGMVPSLNELPRGCRFQDRCDAVFDQCRKEIPDLKQVDQTRQWSRCFKEDQ